MSAPPALLVLASGVQGGGNHPVRARDTLLVVGVIVGMAALAGVLVAIMRRRRRRARSVSDQWAALAVMGELCPDGWQATINLYGWGAPVPSDAPPSRAPLVELEWKQFEEGTGKVAIARRTWAQSIPEALDAMVADRRTDLTLEQIEREAGGQELWGGS